MKNNFWALFLRTIKDRRTTLIIYCVVVVLMMWMYVALFPIMKDQGEKLEEVFKLYPPAFIEAFNLNIKTFITLEGFLSMEQFSLIWPIFAIIIAVSLAGSSLAGEIEKGTMELLLSQPISRIKIFLSKYLAGILIMLIFVIVSIYAVAPIAAVHKIDYPIENFAKFSIIAFMFLLAINGISMFFASLFSQKGKVYFISAGIVVTMYVANIVANIKESLNDLKFLSFFYYYDSAKILIGGNIDNWSYLVFLGIAVIFTVLGAIIFIKRDVAV
jgi:ABC-2 type transport system permease protein